MISSASFTFTQDGLGTTTEFETLTVNLEYQIPGECCFVVIKTKGWSVDDGNELKKLIDKCIKAAMTVVFALRNYRAWRPNVSTTKN